MNGVTSWVSGQPRDVGPYADPVVGSLAFALLLALIASVLLGTAYAARLWRRRRDP